MPLGHDVRVAVRGLLRAPGQALLVVLTPGLAIVANCASFSLIDRVALRPLPVEKPEQVVTLTAQPLPLGGPSCALDTSLLTTGAAQNVEALRD